jgi:alpha-tubulin suppressor-like RCC1 family protein
MFPPRRLALAAAVVALPLLLASCSRTYSSGNEFRNGSSFAALKADGSVVAWGSPSRGGDPLCVNNPSSCGAAPAGSLSSGVVDIFSSYGAYAALKSDGSLVVWGGPSYGGEISCAIAGPTCHPVSQAALSSGVRTVASTYQAFAATRTDGSVVTWGATDFGGDASCTPTDSCSPTPAGALASGVAQVRAGHGSFAALKTDGTVVAWGNPTSGGDVSAPVGGPLTGVTSITPGGYAFSAIRSGGSVITWGQADLGGDPACSASTCTPAPAGSLSSGVRSINTTNEAFAALRNDGSVITWGTTSYGGDSSAPVGGTLTNVTALTATDAAFASLRTDGSVVTWGNGAYGGNSACAPSGDCEPAATGGLLSGVVGVFATRRAFAALKQDGSVVTWGDPEYGGDSACATDPCRSAPAGSLSGGVTQIMATSDAFAARKQDGSVVTWGSSSTGGDSAAPVGGALARVSQVFSNNTAGAALTASGSVVTWGSSTQGGDAACTPSTTCSPAPAGSLSSGVVYIASPFVDLPATPATPATPASPGGTAVPTTVAALPGRTTCTRLRCTTTGRVPAGVTRVTQVASLTSRATQRSAGLTATAARRLRGQCTVSAASRTYTCTVRLSPGRWAITTTALTGSTVSARSVKRVRVVRPAAPRAVTG